ITGETGAGKSIMLGAIGLLIGNRADTSVLLEEKEKCVVEATFDIKAYKLKPFFKEQELEYDNETIVRREILPSGKSRAFVNDTPVTLPVLKLLGERLVDIHSQHQTLLLGKEDFQLKIVDSFVNKPSLLEEYQTTFREYKQVDSKYEELLKESESLKEKLDYNSFLFNELQEINLVEGEQDQLEENTKKVESAEEIKTQLNTVLIALEKAEPSLLDNLYDVSSALSPIQQFSEKYVQFKQRIDQAIYELKDLCSEIENEDENLAYDPATANELKTRLSTIYALQQKHRVNTVEELLTIQQELGESVSATENLDEQLEDLRTERNALQNEIQRIGGELTTSRQKVASTIQEQLEKLLHVLGMPDAVIKLQFTAVEPTPTGLDKVEFLFSANKGVAPDSLVKVASGGEFSRLMFAIKYVMAGKTAMPTVIFDEIDTGVSGEIAIKLAEMMKKMASHHQLICISHLPQVAAKGEHHYFVFKDNSDSRTKSKMKLMTQEERLAHLAEMIGGANASSHAVESAKELLG
ncbi:MAG: DNA repair protein RecN, partial [Cyclobacteriaceae bacterium]